MRTSTDPTIDHTQDTMGIEEGTVPCFSTGDMAGVVNSTHNTDTEDAQMLVRGGTIVTSTITIIIMSTLMEESGTVDGKTVPDLTYEIGFSFT